VISQVTGQANHNDVAHYLPAILRSHCRLTIRFPSIRKVDEGGYSDEEDNENQGP
jgi:hypothetical protein